MMRQMLQPFEGEARLNNVFKNSLRTAKKTLHSTITKFNWLMSLKEIIVVYTVNHMKYKRRELFIIKEFSLQFLFLVVVTENSVHMQVD
jgi:transposase-like protein